jgi:heptaprenyl diphosphate synthase
MLLMHTTAILAYLPVLLVSGCIAGAFTGLCAQLTIRRIERSGK